MLGGVVPELRASAMMAPPVLPPPATQLPPAAAAMLYSSAAADSDVRMLLASVGRGATVMPPEHTYIMGGQGQGVALPVKNDSGVVSAYLLYATGNIPNGGGQANPQSVKLLLKENGTATVALGGKTYQTPPEAADKVELLYASFFTDKFVEGRVAAEVNRQAALRKRPGQPAVLVPTIAIAPCVAQFQICLSSLLPKVGIAKGSLADLALATCIMFLVATQTAIAGAPGYISGSLACALVAQYVPAWQVGHANCMADFSLCLAKVIPNTIL
jgi:hypothetical protein